MPVADRWHRRTLSPAIHPIVNGFACPSCTPFSVRGQFVHDDHNGQVSPRHLRVRASTRTCRWSRAGVAPGWSVERILYRFRYQSPGAEPGEPCNRSGFGDWWTAGGSNPRPLHCERSALPAELAALGQVDFTIARLVPAVGPRSVACAGRPRNAEALVRPTPEHPRRRVLYSGNSFIFATSRSAQPPRPVPRASSDRPHSPCLTPSGKSAFSPGAATRLA